MKSRDSQSRRRRLIHRGLLGQASAPEEEVDHSAIAASESEPSFEPDDDIEQATLAFLAAPAERIEKAIEPIDPSGEIPTQFENRSPDSDPHAGLAAIRSLLRGKSPVTWVFTGDNIVQGAGCTEGRRNCVEIFAERLRGELQRAADVVINTGVSGDTATQLLGTLRRRTIRYRPDVTVISLGINDCKAGAAGREPFRRMVRAILDRVRTAGGIPLVILPHPVYVPATRNRADLRQYVEILRQEIVRDEVPAVDQWADWMQNWPDPEDTRSRLYDGRIQLNADAHQHLAALIFKTLEIFDV
ncbi:MAG: SGNH/GDSL hydrolase family protein, partial [Planctomycetota bacterium]